MNGSYSKNILADFYQKDFKIKRKPSDENGVEDSDSSSDEDFICGSSLSDNSQSSSSNSSKEQSDNEFEENEQSDSEKGKSLNGDTSDEKIARKNLDRKLTDQTKSEKCKINSDIENSLSKISKKNSLESFAKKNNNTVKVIKKHEYCCICLSDQSESDELVACDSCGFFVHEGCYGIPENDSLQDSSCSVASSASTEPWFCNSCLYENNFEPKASLEVCKFQTRECELCPNLECGLLKETNTGRHETFLKKGVTFQSTDKLWPVVLNGIPSSKWGEKVCSLCDNLSFARTGVAIQCDAGLCKTFFHVTCAQKHGLLPDPNHQNLDDPFFAYCKQHNEKAEITSRKSKYEVMIADYNSKKLKNVRLFENYTDKDRLSKKFKKAKTNYQNKRQKLLKYPIDNKKVPRMLTTCPSALKMLLAKTNLNNYEIEKNEDESYIKSQSDQQSHISSSTVAFSVDFVKYYYEREKRILQFKNDLSLLKEAQIKLTQEEIDLRCQYEKKIVQHKKIIEKNKQSKEKYQTIGNIIDLIQSPKRETKKFKKKSDLNKILKGVSANPNVKNSKSTKKAIKNDDIILLDFNINSGCCVCNKKTNSHLLIDCDTCKNIYHINCLNPPMNTVPRKTKLYGWECCKCVHKKNKDNSGEFEETLSDTSKGEDNLSKSTKRERKSTSRFIIDSVDLKTNKRKKSHNLNKAKKIQKNSIHSKLEESSSKSTNEKIKTSQFSDKQQDEEFIYLDDDESELINENKYNSSKGEEGSNLSPLNKCNHLKKRNSVANSNNLNKSVNSSIDESINKKID